MTRSTSYTTLTDAAPDAVKDLLADVVKAVQSEAAALADEIREGGNSLDIGDGNVDTANHILVNEVRELVAFLPFVIRDDCMRLIANANALGTQAS